VKRKLETGGDPGTGGNGEFYRLMARYAPVVMLMPASMFAGYMIGYGLDYAFSTNFLKFIFLILGVVAGIVQLIRILGKDA
jgi:hypothetical protein